MQNNSINDGHISLKEAAERYGVQHDRLRRAAYEGRLLGNRDGQHWVVQPSEVERFIRDNGRAPVIAARPRREALLLHGSLRSQFRKVVRARRRRRSI